MSPLKNTKRYTIHLKLLLHDQVATVRDKLLGPVVQSILSLMKSLDDSINHIVLKKLTAVIIFAAKHFRTFAYITIENFLLTKSILSFEKLGPGKSTFPGQGICGWSGKYEKANKVLPRRKVRAHLPHHRRLLLKEKNLLTVVANSFLLKLPPNSTRYNSLVKVKVKFSFYLRRRVRKNCKMLETNQGEVRENTILML